MIDISILEKELINNGYSEELATAKLCQDIILMMLSKSKFSRNITIKGGVVMSFISKNIRRATIDIDLDLIKFPLTVQGIKTFVKELNGIDGIKIKLIGKIEDLKHQDYQGKRIHVELEDNNKNKLISKIDIGVHKYFDLDQIQYCFDVATSDESASLLINSPEQMVAEKIKSLLRFGVLSTRYKDVYDVCYLLDFVDRKKLNKAFEILIYSNGLYRNYTIEDIAKNLSKTFNDKVYLQKLNTSNKNWLNIDNQIVIDKILKFFKNM
ncbi:MAG: nucleotidyl transferase AbiEii/AbiGii toxin family protein [Bacilli bacterium]|nr:nucleotidyl transferase AbiEii/AbiGii toxin family protein [Bacilli bacterium]